MRLISYPIHKVNFRNVQKKNTYVIPFNADLSIWREHNTSKKHAHSQFLLNKQFLY